MVRDMNDQDDVSGNGIFKFEPTLVGLDAAEEVAESDLVQIRSMWDKKGVLWVHTGSRWGSGYYELLANNNDDNWGLHNPAYLNYRNQVLHRFSIHIVRPENVPAWAQESLKSAVDAAGVGMPLTIQGEVIQRNAEKVEEMKQALDQKAIDEQCKIDQVAALQKEFPHVAGLPVGFKLKPGKLHSVSAGMNEVWAITADNRLCKMVHEANPWKLVEAKDLSGKNLIGFKSVSVGGDGTMYVVLSDGSVYRHKAEKLKKGAKKNPKKDAKKAHAALGKKAKYKKNKHKKNKHVKKEASSVKLR